MQVNINDLVYLSSKVIGEYVKNKKDDDIEEHVSFYQDEGKIKIENENGEPQFHIYINENKNVIEVYQINKPFFKKQNTLVVRKIINFCDLLIRESEGKLSEDDFTIPSLYLSLKNTRFAFA